MSVEDKRRDYMSKTYNIIGAYAGLLINFGNPKRLISERYIYDYITGSYEYVRSKKDFVSDL
jgi:hypothetical protein